MTIALLSACVWMMVLLVMFARPGHVVMPVDAPRLQRAHPASAHATNEVSILDVARPADGSAWRLDQLAALLRLAPDELIVSVDDEPVGFRMHDEAERDRVFHLPEPGQFVDFTVMSEHGSRRVIALLH